MMTYNVTTIAALAVDLDPGDRRIRERDAPAVGPEVQLFAAAALVSGLVLALWMLRPPLLALVAILAVSGVVESSLTPWAQTIRMRLIPPHLRGRVFALLRTLKQSTRPVGAIVAGLLLAGGNLTPALAAIALLVAVPGAIGLWLPALGRGPTAEP